MLRSLIRSVVKYLFSTSNHNTSASIFFDCSVVKYLFSTSNHNCLDGLNERHELSNISFLHQTTTAQVIKKYEDGCQISLFYIKPQRSIAPCARHARCQISLFYIKPQLIALACSHLHGCQISLFYIKPQHEVFGYQRAWCCQISLFYIKPQLSAVCCRR